MSEEFEGNIPSITIDNQTRSFFAYKCDETEQILRSSCANKTPLSDKCFNCIGMNMRFAKFFSDNRNCSCGMKVDFGYFILIFCLEKAGLLPEDFKIVCCICNNESTLLTCEACGIDGA